MTKKREEKEAPQVRNKLFSDAEIRAVSEEAVKRTFDKRIDKGYAERDSAIADLIEHCYGSSRDVIARTPKSLLRRAVVGGRMERYGGHQLRLYGARKGEPSHVIFNDTIDALQPTLPNDAMPSSIDLSGDAKGTRLAEKVAACCAALEDLYKEQVNVRNEISRALRALKRTKAAAEALPELADLIVKHVSATAKPVVPAEQVAKVRALLGGGS
jgi:hypothetical protein